MTALTIAHRFRGPSESGNGGYVCGRVAAHVEAAVAEVTLRRPPPLERPLTVESRDGATRVLDGEAVVAEGIAAALTPEVPRTVTVDEARTVEAPWSDDEHPFPECFVCGPAREAGDALRLRPGRIGDGSLVAAVWTPDASLAGADGRIRPEFVWAALDCPGAFAVEQTGRGLHVLGRLAARIDERPRAGEPHVVVAWPLGSEGRKHFAGTSLLTANGELLAHARATWISLSA